ncbi:MAG: metallopeptidase TldD-related protein [Thermoanaerobaculia bacterium]|nr:metallopeptidase TldD-related protein [Thermoanaerobaculia bacterium]
MPERPLSIEAISRLLEHAVDSSPADETELVWLEVQRGRLAGEAARLEAPRRLVDRTVLVRVIDRGRVGLHRLGAAELGEIQNGIRSAIAQSRGREPVAGLPHLPLPEEGEDRAAEGLRDPELARLASRHAKGRIAGLLAADERARLEWADASVAVVSSRGVRRAVSVTAVQLGVRSGRPGQEGRAVAAGRRLADIHPEALVERARRRRGESGDEAEIGAAVPLVLAPEAVIELVDFLAREAFSAKAYHDGTSLLREHLGVQVFDRTLELADDATDPAGIPFPFDLEGSPKRRVGLIVKGAPKTPTLDQRQAAVLGLPATAHAIGGNDSQPLNLFLAAGEATEEELLREAEGGLWIGALDRIETLEPRRLRFRARAAGVRRIRGGALAGRLRDLTWEDSLLRALGELRGLGRDLTTALSRDGFLGGTSAPALALGPAEGLSPRRG